MKWANSRIEVIFLIIILFFLIYQLQTILIPLAFAFLLAMFTQPLVKLLQKYRIPRWVSIPVVIIITLGVITLIALVLNSTLGELQGQREELYQNLNEKFTPLFQWLNELSRNYTGAELNLATSIQQLLNSEFLKESVGNFLNVVTNFASSFFMFAFYFIVFLVSMSGYEEYFKYVSGGKASESTMDGYKKIQSSVHTYVKVKVGISILTAFFTMIVLLIFGVKFAMLWVLLTFLLNLIPFIGSAIAVMLPFLMSIVQFDAFASSLLLLALLVAVQYSIGNVLEPILMGNSLNLNTIAALFSLVFWTYLWGVAGALLGVPLMVIFKLLLEQTKDMAPIGRILGDAEHGLKKQEQRE